MAYKNKKIAFVFPGQGAQYVGMGMEFIDKNPQLLEPLRRFDQRNGTSLEEVIRNGTDEELKETRYTQPAILYHSIIAMQSLLKEIDLKPDYVAGHSLGEITALVANGVLNLEDAMYLVHKRGEFMIKANQGEPFAMAAIIGLDAEVLKQICLDVSQEHLVVVANYNTPEQIVISGSEEGVNRASELAKEKGAKRALPLAVGGPFHSPMIEKAGLWLGEEMSKMSFNSTAIPVISNVDAKPHFDPNTIRENLVKQVTSSVLWVDSIKEMVSLGVELFIEFGPKRVVSGMIKKIDRNVDTLSIDEWQDIVTVKEYMEKL